MTSALTFTTEVSASPTTPAPSSGRDCPQTAHPDFFARRNWSWRSGICTALDHRFEVFTEAPMELGPLIAPITVPLHDGDPLHADDDAGVASSYRIVHRNHEVVPLALYYNRTRLLLSRTPEPILRFLTWHINRQAIDKGTVHRVVLHAAAATRAGITVVLPAEQEHGKTTTVAGLLRDGYEYVTDEAVAVTPATGRIRPFPKALSLDEGSWHLFPECRPSRCSPQTRQWQVPAEHLGSRGLRGTVATPRVIVFPRYVAGSRTELVPMSRAEALHQLIQSTFYFDREPARNLRTLGILVRDASVRGLTIGSLDEAVAAIEQLVSETLMKEM